MVAFVHKREAAYLNDIKGNLEKLVSLEVPNLLAKKL